MIEKRCFCGWPAAQLRTRSLQNIFLLQRPGAWVWMCGQDSNASWAGWLKLPSSFRCVGKSQCLFLKSRVASQTFSFNFFMTTEGSLSAARYGPGDRGCGFRCSPQWRPGLALRLPLSRAQGRAKDRWLILCLSGCHIHSPRIVHEQHQSSGWHPTSGSCVR